MSDPCELCLNNVQDEYGSYYCAQGAALDEDGHISKVFGDAEAGWADFVFTMDEGQRDELRLRYPELRVECLSAFCGSEIADPYGGEQADYDATADIFEALLPAVLDFVEKNSPQAEKDA